jgi:hypothetical protein
VDKKKSLIPCEVSEKIPFNNPDKMEIDHPFEILNRWSYYKAHFCGKMLFNRTGNCLDDNKYSKNSKFSQKLLKLNGIGIN